MRALHRIVLTILTATLVTLGCHQGEPVYAPRGATQWSAGLPSLRLSIPPERPTGALSLASFGLTQLSADGSAVDTLHVQFVADNLSDRSWTIDAREQLIEIAGQGRSRARLVNTDSGAAPIVSIPPRQRRVIDFYFPLPPTLSSIHDLETFDVLWQVRTGERIVAARSSFDQWSTDSRYADARYAYGGWYAGWGAYWWYDPYWLHHPYWWHHPYYGYYDYHGGPFFWSHHPHVVVTHAPHGHFGGTFGHHSHHSAPGHHAPSHHGHGH